MMTGVPQSSYSIRQMLHSVGTLWEMQLPPEFVSTCMPEPASVTIALCCLS